MDANAFASPSENFDPGHLGFFSSTHSSRLHKSPLVLLLESIREEIKSHTAHQHKMDAQREDQQPNEADQAELNDFGKIAVQFLKYGQNASNNLQAVFTEMSVQQWLRLVIVVGGYILLRQQAIKYMSRKKVDSMEDEDAKAKAELSPNQLRGEKGPVEIGDVDDEGEGTASDWGANARVRQRKMLKHLMEAEERRRQDEEDDKDIADLLED